MTKKKLIEDIKQEPPRFYRTPADVLRDRRFDDSERLEILLCWRDCAASGAQTISPQDVEDAIGALENRGLSAAQ